jgi:hypothetical protein
MNPRETMIEEFLDEFEIEQAVPLDFTANAPPIEPIDERCGEYFKDPGCIYNRYRLRTVHSSQHSAYQLSKISRLPANAEVAYCFDHVPDLYFHPDFSIQNPETFNHIIKVEQRIQQSVISSSLVDSTTTTVSSPTTKRRGYNSNDETSLTTYLDLVEIALLRQIMTRSPAFFKALDDIYELQSMVSRAATRVIHLRRHLKECDRLNAVGPVRLTRIEQRRINEVKVYEKVRYMQRVKIHLSATQITHASMIPQHSL